jgi:hypothetical protein
MLGYNRIQLAQGFVQVWHGISPLPLEPANAGQMRHLDGLLHSTQVIFYDIYTFQQKLDPRVRAAMLDPSLPSGLFALLALPALQSP